MGASDRRAPRLVGRSSEWSAARWAFRNGRDGVLFAGPPGAGKTTLARAVAEELAAREDAELVWLIGSDPQAPIPFGPFAPLAPDLGAKPGRQPDPLYLLQSFRAAVTRRAKSRPVVLAVDDAHKFDPHSATLLLQLVADRSVKLVMAMTSAMPVPSPIRTLWKEELVERIEVGPLDREATADLVGDILADEPFGLSAGGVADMYESPAPHPVGGELTEAVWRLSTGNPLYVRELIRSGLDAGSMVLRNGVWRLGSDLELGPRLEELLAERVGPLSAPERETLELIAFADPVPLAVLMRLVEAEPIETLQMAGLVRFDWTRGEQVARSDHRLVSELVRRTVSVPRAAAIGRRLADAFEAEGRLGRELLRVVTWRLDGGADPAAADLVEASRRAAEEQDWRLSARLGQAAVERGGGMAARVALVDALRALGRYTEALALLAVPPEDGSAAHSTQVAALRAHLLFLSSGGLHEPLAIVEDAAAGTDDPSDQAWLQAIGAGLRGFAGRPAEALEQARAVLARPGLEPRAELTARTVVSLALSWGGLCEQALTVLDGVDTRSEEMGAFSSWAISARVIAYRAAARVDALERVARLRYERAARLHDDQEQGAAATALGWTSLMQARIPQSIAWFREAAAALLPGNSLSLRLPPLLGLAEALALAGDADGARSFLELTRPAAEHSTLVMVSWSVADAWLSAANGALKEAFDQLERAASAAADRNAVSWEVQARHSAVRLGSAAPAARLAELATWVEGPLIRVAADHAAALDLTSGSGDALDGVAERYADLGLHLFAAEAAAQACRAFRSAGQSRRAAASAARGHMLLGSGEDGPRPVGLALALTPPVLTRREREVAMLAARGLPSQTIATRLSLSVRTVDTHLARVYVKLGISGRTELAVALVSAAAASGQVEAG